MPCLRQQIERSSIPQSSISGAPFEHHHLHICNHDRMIVHTPGTVKSTTVPTMEAFTTIQIISSIVQLVDFGSECVAKGVELYRSNDDVLNENAAIEIAATHLTTLNNEVNNAFSNADQQLQGTTYG
ncbi:hypothetical protein F4860DRAFT_458214 [Xylaria cubensis]|nr:hypothetical protein F4860DRAFT_458214 [Xylaria cubensis]